MDKKFLRLPLNIIPLVEEMWDIQERDGYCEVRTSQRPNPWKEEEAGGGDDDGGGGSADDDVQAYICVSRS